MSAMGTPPPPKNGEVLNVWSLKERITTFNFQNIKNLKMVLGGKSCNLAEHSFVISWNYSVLPKDHQSVNFLPIKLTWSSVKQLSFFENIQFCRKADNIYLSLSQLDPRLKFWWVSQFYRKIVPKTGLKSHPVMKCAMENNISTDIAALR